MKQLSGLDAFFVSGEHKTTPMHVAAFMVYEPEQVESARDNFERVHDLLERRMGNSAVFRRRLVTDPLRSANPWWVEDAAFDIDNHVSHRELKKGCSTEDLNKLLAELHKKGLNMDRPLWELCVVDGLGYLSQYARGAYGLYVKVHHSAVDGVSGVEIISAINDLDPDAREPEPDAWEPEEKLPGKWELAWKSYEQRTRRALHNFQTIADIAPELVQKLPPRFEESAPAAHPKHWVSTPLGRAVGPERVIETLQIDQRDYRAVRRLLPRLTSNHVFLAGVSAALRCYLQKRGELPKESLSTAIPVNVRKRGDEIGGNKINIALCSLHTDLEDPLERLEAVRDAAIESQKVSRDLGSNLLERIAGLVSPQVSRLALNLLRGVTGLAGTLPLPVQTFCTNVPGPPVPLYLNGDRMVDLQVFGSIMDSIGMFHALTNYNGKINISVLASPNTLEEPALYRTCLEQGFDELIDLAKNARSDAK